MADQIASRDPNRIPSLLGVDSIAFDETTTAAVDPVTHELLAKVTGAVTVPLITNYAKETGGNLDDINTNTDKLDVALSTRLAEATFTARINTLGQKTMANSTPVVLPSDQSAIPISTAQDFSDTATVTSVSVSTVVVTLLSSNANRKGFIIYNNGTTQVFIKFGTGATTSSFTLVLNGSGFYESSKPIYRGAITAIRNAGTANVLVTELT